MNNALLFMIPALVWGSTWLAIRFQLGVVDPVVSVAYRFLAAAGLMLLYCGVRGIDLRLGLRGHLFVALQGVLLFGVNYWLVYRAELVLPSGLVAVVFSAILFANVLNGRIFLGAPIRRPVVAGGLLGFAGLSVVFAQEVTSFSLSNRSVQGLGLALASVYMASLGNILSARNQRAGMTVVQTNTLGMLYGGLIVLAIATALGKPLLFDTSFSYVASLIYLSVFGSVLAFACFLTLLGRIGADRAAYVALVMPVIALLLTTVFEGYEWTLPALLGVALVLAGNFLALRRGRRGRLGGASKASGGS
jgi:drug/metabolite transporter (DMT)-like permease